MGVKFEQHYLLSENYLLLCCQIIIVQGRNSFWVKSKIVDFDEIVFVDVFNCCSNNGTLRQDLQFYLNMKRQLNKNKNLFLKKQQKNSRLSNAFFQQQCHIFQFFYLQLSFISLKFHLSQLICVIYCLQSEKQCVKIGN